MAKDAVAAAARLQANIDEAKASNNWRNGWYAHMAPWDVEAVVAAVLEGGQAAEPEPERMVKVSVLREDGSVVAEWDVPESDIDLSTQPDGSNIVTFPTPIEGFGGDLGGTLDPKQNTYITGTGQHIAAVHDPALCAGRACVIHAPSDHHMRSWPTNFRVGGVFDIKGPHMERICPHGVGHPDPDDLAFWRSQGEEYGVHGCDGCCTVGGYERVQAGAYGAHS